MLSVIVPTAWAFKPFCNFLSNVVELPVVGEVIIINNVVERTPKHPVLSHSKVRVYNQDKNIFVNPAWNLGVSYASNDKICILSDDVLVDLRVFFEADKFVNKQIGTLAIGIHFDLYRAQNDQFELVNDVKNLVVDGDIKIKEFGPNVNMSGSGSLFFLDKENWVNIPNEFKVNWGDTWQFKMQECFARKNYFINNCFYYTPWSMAVKTGISCDYQSGEEYKKYENSDYFNLAVENHLKDVNHGR